MQSHAVNAEIPAIAFTASAVWLVVCALQEHASRGRFAYGVGAGVAGMCALLVKQSFLDGLVFAGAALVTLLVLDRGVDDARRGRAGVVLAGGVVGIVATTAGFVAWAELW
jgi:4-amino-4-deoxy-L-arabinose transferase-like glycosyltransferase